MSNSFRISLKGGERIFINGAVLRADRRVTLELLNDVSFLLEHHVMTAEQVHTPLGQLYLHVQDIIIEPLRADEARIAALEKLVELRRQAGDCDSQGAAYERIGDALALGRPFEALKLIRLLMSTEKAPCEVGRTEPVRDQVPRSSKG